MDIRSKLDLLSVTEDNILAQRGRVRLRLKQAQAGARLARLAYIADYDTHTELRRNRQVAQRGGRGRGRPSF